MRLTDILLDNAFKYTSDSGMVRLNLESKGERQAMSVEDSGVGIAKEERQKIFERFTAWIRHAAARRRRRSWPRDRAMDRDPTLRALNCLIPVFGHFR